MKRGVPPTEVNARTGELTPPGMTADASAKRRADTSVEQGSAGISPVFQPGRGRQLQGVVGGPSEARRSTDERLPIPRRLLAGEAERNPGGDGCPGTVHQLKVQMRLGGVPGVSA